MVMIQDHQVDLEVKVQIMIEKNKLQYNIDTEERRGMPPGPFKPKKPGKLHN